MNAVCPGVIATEMITRLTQGVASTTDQLVQTEPIWRMMGTPEGIANAVIGL